MDQDYRAHACIVLACSPSAITCLCYNLPVTTALIACKVFAVLSLAWDAPACSNTAVPQPKQLAF